MSLIVLEQASLAFGGQQILGGDSLRIADRDRIGLVGPNGSGKSTLLRVMCGEQAVDGGDVRRARSVRIGYLPQDVLAVAGDTLLGSVLDTVPGRGDIEQRLTAAEAQLSASDDADEQLRLATTLAELNEQLEHFETYYSERRASRILFGLGFAQRDLCRPTAELSGGWKMRAALAGLLFQNPDVLFLDEPTNHLDVPSVRWLDGFLDECKGALVLICHDREFLNRHVDRVLAFEPEGLRAYRGNYDRYCEQRAAEREVLEARARNRERELKEKQRFVERFKAKANKARQAQSRAKQVRRLERQLQQEAPLEDRSTLSFSFPKVARSGRDVVQLCGVSKSFGQLRLYQQLDKNVYAGDRIGIIGVNGAGKTTLLKIIAGELAPDEGDVRRGANVELGYYAQHHTEQLEAKRTVLEEVWRVAPKTGETVIRSVCGGFLFRGDDVTKKIAVLSGGERARVLLARLMVRPTNLLLMDEPTNHLDIASAEALAEALARYEGTLVFVSHNSSFVNRLATKVWDISGGDVVEHPGNLRDYLERQARIEAEEQARQDEPRPSEAAAMPAADDARSESHSERKARKRREAEQRNALARRTRAVRDKVAQLEARIGTLEQEQGELEPQLADPQLYKDGARFRQTLQRYQQNKAKLEELYGRWEHQQEELQRVEQETLQEGDTGT